MPWVVQLALMPKSYSMYESENILIHRPILCSRYVADPATRFYWVCPTTWGAGRVVEGGVPNPWPPKPQAEQLLGLRAPSPLWVPGSGSSPRSPTAMSASCPQAAHESALRRRGGMVPSSCVLCSFFLIPCLLWVIEYFSWSHYMTIIILLDIYIIKTKEAEPIGYIKRFNLTWLGGLTSRKSGCSGRSWCSLESKICSIGQQSWKFRQDFYVTILRQNSCYFRKPQILS